jgi:alkylated DNA nucleotide flippase Atl1
MQVQTATLKELVQGEKQFLVPIWQRQYTWKGEQHEQLWHDLMEQYRLVNAGDTAVSGHFLGSFVLSPKDPMAAGVSHFLVIDGQQRLTTLMLLLCALRDELAASSEQAIERYDETYLLNKFYDGDDRVRLLPTEEDRKAFRRWVLREPDNNAGDDISRAYRFFAAKLRGSDAVSLDLDLLTQVVVERLEIVLIHTQHGDNAHRIFQSLNGTGVRLNQADLLRNYLFMLLPTRAEAVYQEIWRPMEQLIGVDNLAGLARLDLQRRGWDVTTDDVYMRHQARIDPISHSEAKVEEQVRDLAKRAAHYQRLINPVAEPDAQARAGLQRLARWGAQTAHPTLMVALDLQSRGIITTDDFRRVVLLIESFFVRRQLARIPTNALNRVFVQIIDKLPEDGTFVEALHKELSRDRLYWPNDDQIRQAARTQPFFHIGRWHQRKQILEQLERSFGHVEVVDFAEANLQIEHIMPQTLSVEWRVHLEDLGQDPDEVHQELVHTLGNVTLTGYNGTLSNNPFERKQEIYGASNLQMNKALVENQSWGRDEILDRADALAAKAISIWAAPLPGIVSGGDGFDWSRVEAAIAAIPSGRWTNYGALAEIAGTSAQAVGNYIGNHGEQPNAYRVLSAYGSVSEGFHWADAADERDVRQVLAAEGVEFNPDGYASDEQWLSPEELVALIEMPDDAVDEDAALTAPA